MRHHLPQNVDTLLTQFDSLQTIQQKALALAKLNQAVSALLPKPLQTHCRVANLRQNTLILEVESANWLNRLRYEQETLRLTLRASILPSLAGIAMYINPNIASDQRNIKELAENPPEATVKKPISEESAAILAQFAEKCPDSLRNKLYNIIKLAKTK